jgi:hypothetical protein
MKSKPGQKISTGSLSAEFVKARSRGTVVRHPGINISWHYATAVLSDSALLLPVDLKV